MPASVLDIEIDDIKLMGDYDRRIALVVRLQFHIIFLTQIDDEGLVQSDSIYTPLNLYLILRDSFKLISELGLFGESGGSLIAASLINIV
jgi:hypothetical protein